jgi:hypothetical protein
MYRRTERETHRARERAQSLDGVDGRSLEGRKGEERLSTSG